MFVTLEVKRHGRRAAKKGMEIKGEEKSWIYMKDGTEQVWTDKKVKNAENIGIIGGLSYLVGLGCVGYAFYCAYWITWTGSIIGSWVDIIFNSILWIGMVFLLIGHFIAVYSFDAENAKKVRDLKKC